MKLEEIAGVIIAVLQEAGLPFMVVGGLSSNVYSIARSTKAVDIVIGLESPGQLRRIEELLPARFRFDPQVTFEGITGNIRHIIQVEGTPFVIELFELPGDDAFQLQRFGRRREIFLAALNVTAPIPTAEDVVVQKLRWGRPKDIEDVRGILTVQGPSLDYAHIEDWCGKLNILDRYHAVRATVPEI